MPTSIDLEMFRTVVNAFAGVIIAALFAFAVVGGIAFFKVERGAGKSFGLMFSRGNFLRILTVVICVFALVVLSFADKLSEGSVSVLSGIVGFVLGGVSKDGALSSSTENGKF